ncbi:hypothetical protein KAW96_02550 [candidate division WOR-3 bacterium]|nr:hypothetical protein [candidate division WOR-3 bacterium]
MYGVIARSEATWQSHYEKVLRTWKGYPFEILDELTEKGYIRGSKRAKSVYLSEEGIKKAEELKKKYLRAK